MYYICADFLMETPCPHHSKPGAFLLEPCKRIQDPHTRHMVNNKPITAR